jgi:CDP-diacylglycerol--glycerol-3-phosphate 3-phosphatidyltransferase
LQIISAFSYTLLPSPLSTATPDTYQQDYTLNWPDPQTHPHQIHQKAHTALYEFQLSQRTVEAQSILKDVEAAANQSPVESDKVLIFPIIQAGQFNIQEEETTLALLFRLLDFRISKAATTRPLVDLTSGYFGLYEPYQKHILASDVETRIIAAGPQVDDHGLLYI